MSESFFSRWSRRKQEQAAGQPALESARAAEPVASASLPAPASEDPPKVAPAQTAPAEAPLPTLDDAQALTPDANFQPFMQRGVGPEVRNAAMKKLFADPHFNVMDGLDIYIDDYSQPDPLPAGMLRRMASAQFLKLVPEEVPATQAEPAQGPEGRADAAPATQVVAQSPLPAPTAQAPEHDHPDLQLQPDSAAADPQPGPSAR